MSLCMCRPPSGASVFSQATNRRKWVFKIVCRKDLQSAYSLPHLVTDKVRGLEG